jgi:hypothetical protein
MLPTLNAYSIDPAPLIKLLKDSLDSISSGNYGLSKELVSTALSVDVGDLNYVHRNTYLRLNRLVDLLITYKSLGDTVNTTYLRGLIYDLYRTYYDLNVSITSYVDTLTKYFRDPVLRGKYLSDFYTSLSSTYEVVNDVLNDLIMRYLGIASYILNVSLSVPESVYGGSDYPVTIYVVAPNDVKYVDASIYVSYGGLYTFLNTSIPTNENYSITLKAPPAEEFLVRGLKLTPEVGFELLVRVYGVYNNYTYVGQGVCRGLLKFLKPDLLITPEVVDGLLTSLIINASLNTPLNTSVFVNDELVSSLEVFRGVYEVPLNVDLSTGKLVKVVTEGRGPYLSSLWTYRLVTPTKPEVNVYVGNLVLIPPFNTSITLNVGTTPYILKLSVCGSEFEGLVNTSVTSLSIPIPWNTIVWCDLRVDVKSLGGEVITSKSIRIYVVNIPIITSITIASATLITLPSTRRYLRSLRLYIPKLISYSRSEGGVRSTYVGISFRESKLLRTYRRFVDLISRYVEPPKPSETLREFLVRVKKVFTNPAYELVRTFITNYELELYSRHTPNSELMNKVLRELRTSLKHLSKKM